MGRDIVQAGECPGRICPRGKCPTLELTPEYLAAEARRLGLLLCPQSRVWPASGEKQHRHSSATNTTSNCLLGRRSNSQHDNTNTTRVTDAWRQIHASDLKTSSQLSSRAKSTPSSRRCHISIKITRLDYTQQGAVHAYTSFLVLYPANGGSVYITNDPVMSNP